MTGINFLPPAKKSGDLMAEIAAIAAESEEIYAEAFYYKEKILQLLARNDSALGRLRNVLDLIEGGAVDPSVATTAGNQAYTISEKLFEVEEEFSGFGS